MSENNRFFDRLFLIIMALVVGVSWFSLVLALDSSGISEEWQRFWGAGVIIYLGSAFALRGSIVFNKKKSKFKNVFLHYSFVLVAYFLPVAVFALLFKMEKRLIPLDVYVYGFGGGFLAVVTNGFIENFINKKGST